MYTSYSHIIANQFTDSPYSEVTVNQCPARTPEVGLSRLDHHDDLTIDATSLHEGESDLDTNDAYGGTMFDIGLVVLQDETYTNEHTTSSHNSIALNECQTDSDARVRSKVTMMMTDNAAYYTNLSQVTEI